MSGSLKPPVQSSDQLCHHFNEGLAVPKPRESHEPRAFGLAQQIAQDQRQLHMKTWQTHANTIEATPAKLQSMQRCQANAKSVCVVRLFSHLNVHDPVTSLLILHRFAKDLPPLSSVA